MNILIYIPLVDQGWGGVKQYTIGLLKVLLNDTTNKYYLYHNSSDKDVTKIIASNNNFHLLRREVDMKISSKHGLYKKANSLLQTLRISVRLPIDDELASICKKFKIDIIHCPYQFVPTIENVKIVTTMHDVQELHFPEYFSAEERASRALGYFKYLKLADRIVVSYNHVKDDLIKYFSVPADRINVILIDMGKLWLDAYLPTIPKDIKGLALPEKYLLYPANTWQHKNHIRLLEALLLIKEKYGVVVNVVFTGHKNEHYDSICKFIETTNLENQAKFLGIVDEDILFSLYRNAIGVVIPTTYEAGSFPLYESILIGAPVICSNVTSLPETIEDSQFLFNPFSVEDIADKLLKLWQDESFRNSSLNNSEKISSKIREETALPHFQNLYKQIGN